MNKLKFPAMILAFVLAITASAFTFGHKAKPVKQSQWYEFVGTTYDLSAVKNEANYEYRPSYTQFSGSDKVNAILTTGSVDTNGNPDSFDGNMLTAIENAYTQASVAAYIDMKDE